MDNLVKVGNEHYVVDQQSCEIPRNKLETLVCEDLPVAIQIIVKDFFHKKQRQADRTIVSISRTDDKHVVVLIMDVAAFHSIKPDQERVESQMSAEESLNHMRQTMLLDMKRLYISEHNNAINLEDWYDNESVVGLEYSLTFSGGSLSAIMQQVEHQLEQMDCWIANQNELLVKG